VTHFVFSLLSNIILFPREYQSMEISHLPQQKRPKTVQCSTISPKSYSLSPSSMRKTRRVKNGTNKLRPSVPALMSDPASLARLLSTVLYMLHCTIPFACRVTEGRSTRAGNRTSEVFCLRAAPCAVHADIPRGEKGETHGT
jgi:hypothetical protein